MSDPFHVAALVGTILLPTLFLMYVEWAGEWYDHLIDPPWLKDYAKDQKRRWRFGINTAVFLVSITLLTYIYGGI